MNKIKLSQDTSIIHSSISTTESTTESSMYSAAALAELKKQQAIRPNFEQNQQQDISDDLLNSSASSIIPDAASIAVAKKAREMKRLRGETGGPDEFIPLGEVITINHFLIKFNVV